MIALLICITFVIVTKIICDTIIIDVTRINMESERLYRDNKEMKEKVNAIIDAVNNPNNVMDVTTQRITLNKD